MNGGNFTLKKEKMIIYESSTGILFIAFIFLSLVRRMVHVGVIGYVVDNSG
jgi:hypothetical protein